MERRVYLYGLYTPVAVVSFSRSFGDKVKGGQHKRPRNIARENEL